MGIEETFLPPNDHVLEYKMSGQDGNRGYLVQAIIALLESLSDKSWVNVSIEPNSVSEKIDVLWEEPNQNIRVTQIKSSRNQINKSEVERWANELKKSIIADKYELILIGPTSQSVVDMKSINGVTIPCPKNLDIEGLFHEAAHLLCKFLSKESLHQQTPQHREVMLRALVTELSSLSTNGKKIERDRFVEMLKIWIQLPHSTIDGFSWDRVTFENQRGIESAVAGKRLGPSDVDSCPEFSICNEIFTELDRSHLHEIAGTSGCGKSITAWQVARKFNKLGFTIWRPSAFSTSSQLLTNLPSGKRNLLVVDDAHQYGETFAVRLGEFSDSDLKVLLVSTVENTLLSQVICLSPQRCVQDLASALLGRCEELLPIVQQYDNRVGNRYGDLSLELKIFEARKQNRPWEVFWLIRGGWKTAERELESITQFPNALEVLLMIAIGQIVSCDVGVTREWLAENLHVMAVSDDAADKALKHLDNLNVILLGDSIRTKHLVYANRILELSFRSQNFNQWSRWASIVTNCILNTNWTLKGLTWILGDAIGNYDAFRGKKELFQVLLDPLIDRCLSENSDYDWAAGCMSRLIDCFDLPADRILLYAERLLTWITSGSGLVAYYCGQIINTLINESHRDPELLNNNITLPINNNINVSRLIENANKVEVKDFYTFAYMLDRLAYSRPSWASIFIQGLNWSRLRVMILHADVEYTYAIDKMISSIVALASTQGKKEIKYVKEIIPFISRAINERPSEAVSDLRDIFWLCLGYIPKFLSGGQFPQSEQRSIARMIVTEIDPKVFSLAMANALPRDLERLARSFEVLCEIDKKFVAKVANSLSVEKFFAATETDWIKQSSELSSLLRYFTFENDCEPAASWIRANKNRILGPMMPINICIAPDVAIEFYLNGKGLKLLYDNNVRWHETSCAIGRLYDYDQERCKEIVAQQMSTFWPALYSLCMDPITHLLRFFKVLFMLSPELFAEFINGINLDDIKCVNTIEQLLRRQPNERSQYIKLAKYGMKFQGKLGELATELFSRLNPTQE